MYSYISMYSYLCIHVYELLAVALMVMNPPANARDFKICGFNHWFRRSPGGGHSHPLQYSCLENPMDRGAWQTQVHRVAKSQT